MPFRLLLIFFNVLCTGLATSQVLDDFEDGDFTGGAAEWNGDTAEFQVTDGELRSRGPSSTGVLHLSTPNNLTDRTVWEFYLRIETAPSASNRVRIYLISDTSALEEDVRGYYIEIGQTGDDFLSFFRSDLGVRTLLWSGNNVFDEQVRIKVIRDGSGQWTFFTDHNGNENYILEGNIHDDTYGASTHFGWVVNHTSTRKEDFYMDDVVIDQLRIDTAWAVNDSAVVLAFNQFLDESAAETLSYYSIPGITIVQVSRDPMDTNRVHLTLDAATKLTSGSYTIQVSDQLTLNDPEQFDFSYLQLNVESIQTLADTVMVLNFNDELDSGHASIAANYLIDGGVGVPRSATVNMENLSQVTLQLNKPLPEGSSNLTVLNLKNNAGNSTVSGIFPFEFVIPFTITSIAVISPDQLRLSFNKILMATSAEDVTNYLINQSVGIPYEATMQDDGHSVDLFFATEFTANNYELTVSNVMDEDGNVIDSATVVAFTYLPLDVLQVSQLTDTSILVRFNQSIDVPSAAIPLNYQVEGSYPTAIGIPEENDSLLQLAFSGLSNSAYVLMISGLNNQSGNSTLSKEVNFDFRVPTAFQSIVINEMMVDFIPVVGLPEAEYIELYNASPSDLNLAGFTLNGAVLPDETLAAGQYAILVDPPDEISFSSVANVIGVESFDALTNTGEPVVLRDQFGNVVDSLFYSTTWYQDPLKDDGGYSLERIRPNLPCSGPHNWIAAVDENGGTPGMVNSVFDPSPDNSPPQVVEFAVEEGNTLQVTFDEPLEEGTFAEAYLDLDGWTITGANHYSPDVVEVLLSSSLLSEADYRLTISGVQDCSGNELDTTLTFHYDITPPQLMGSVFISENILALLFHESLSEAEAETEGNYALAGLEPDQVILQDSASNRVHLKFETGFEVGQEYELDVNLLADSVGNVVASQKVNLTFGDHVDSVWVVAPNLLSVSFLDIPEPQTVYRADNFLLEGQHPEQIAIANDDSLVVHLAFGTNFDENKTLTLFMERLLVRNSSVPLITPAYSFIYDTRAPVLKELIVQDSVSVLLRFNEPLDSTYVSSSNLYSVGGRHPLAVFTGVEGSVLLRFSEPFPVEEERTLSFQGLVDLRGNVSGNRQVKFVFDPKPPEVLQALLIDPHRLRIAFSEKLDSSGMVTTNYLMEEEDLPESIAISGPDSVNYTLYFSGAIPSTTNLRISLNHVADKAGNKLERELHVDTKHPVLHTVIPSSDSIVLLGFSKRMRADAGEVSHYSIDRHAVNSAAFSDPYHISLVINPGMIEGDTLMIEVKGVADEDNKLLQQSSIRYIHQKYLVDWEIPDDRTLMLTFETDFSSISADHFLLDGLPPAIVQRDGDNSSVLRLVFSDPIPPDVQLDLVIRNLTDRFDRRIPDAEFPVYRDTKGPELLEITSDYFGTIRIRFSEPLSEASFSANHYRILEIGTAVDASADTDRDLKLWFQDLLVDGEAYHLIITGVTDPGGNQTYDTLVFTHHSPVLPRSGDILISEIMADPIPAMGLPEVEFLELFNRSHDTVNLNSLFFSDNSRKVLLPHYILPPYEYVVLSGGGNSSIFLNTNVLDVPGFQSLGNTGDSLVLSNLSGEIVHSVKYNLDWYGDPAKDDGGYSLELINPFSDCSGIVNWGASVAEGGGTPGTRNSLYTLEPDLQPPTLMSYTIRDDHILQLNFSEPMDSISLVEGHYQIDGLSVEQITVKDPDFQWVDLVLAAEVTYGTLYKLTISNLRDCSGNAFESRIISVGIGRNPGFHELLITEIMADPEPTQGLPISEYIEIYNPTQQLLSLGGVTLSDGSSSADLPGIVLQPGHYAILLPTSSVFAYQDLGLVVGVSGWISLNNSGESIALSAEGTVIHQVQYSMEWHDTPDASDGGFSLEMRDLTNPCAGEVNWGSSTDPAGGTPGYENSIAQPVPDHFGPNLLRSVAISPDTIRLEFDEYLNQYTGDLQVDLDNEEIRVSSTYYNSQEPDHIYAVLDGMLPVNQPMTVTVSGVTDCQGNEIRSNTSLSVLPDLSDSLDVVINEILFNPRPGGVDFVEFYNRSHKYLDLKGWTLARKQADEIIQQSGVSDSELVLAPGAFLALTADPALLLVEYPDAKSPHRMFTFPAFPDELGTVVILDDRGREMDEFSYHEDFHFSLLRDVEGVSLERIDAEAPTEDSNNWASASASVRYATPGARNSQAFNIPLPAGELEITPKVFVPGQAGAPGVTTYTTINYQFDKGGKFANVNVYDQQGRLVHELANGASLSTSGFFRWDGTNDSGNIVRLGYYIVVFEVYDSSGGKDILKETVVVGR